MQTRVTLFRILLLAFTALSLFTAEKVAAQVLPANQLMLPSKPFTLSFSWQGDSINSTWEPHAAVLIPVTLKNCPRKFYMQFDLGSPYSLLYKNKIQAIELKYPGTFSLKNGQEKLENISFTADHSKFAAKEIVVKQFDSTGIDWQKDMEIIGTLGSDLIDNNVVIIDYPHHKLIISDNIPEKLAKEAVLTSFIYANRSVLLPAKLNAKETLLYFDTGSSMFELLTDKETCMQLAIPKANPLQYTVKSWSKDMIANSLPSNASIVIATTSISLHLVTYMEGASDSQIAQMMKMGIGGMTGNKLFLNYVLILDTKRKKFGLAKSL